MDKIKLISPVQTTQNIARFIISEPLQKYNNQIYLSLIFVQESARNLDNAAKINKVQSSNTLNMRKLCLELRTAINIELHIKSKNTGKEYNSSSQLFDVAKATNILNDSIYSIRLNYFTRNFLLSPKHKICAGCQVYLVYLPQALLREESFALIKKDCHHLAQVYRNAATDFSVILWLCDRQNQLGEAEQMSLQEQLQYGLKEFSPQCRLALVEPDSANFCESLGIHHSFPEFPQVRRYTTELQAVLEPASLARLLKGWYRPELQAKGLVRHPAFGLLSDWEIGDIHQLCQSLAANLKSCDN